MRFAIALWTASFAVSAVGEEDVGVPPTLRVYEEPRESERAKGMLNRLVGKWFNRESEGGKEPPLEPQTVEERTSSGTS